MTCQRRFTGSRWVQAGVPGARLVRCVCSRQRARGCTGPPLSPPLQDQDARYRQRYLDLLLSPATRRTFLTRARVVRHLRAFLESRGFLEVETPMLTGSPGGAAARPFRTHYAALGRELALRVAPELYLKQLVVGGLERVFELGRVFRNEGVDATHSPEFTSCEFYQAYESAEGLMATTEALLAGMAMEIHGSTRVPLLAAGEGAAAGAAGEGGAGSAAGGAVEAAAVGAAASAAAARPSAPPSYIDFAPPYPRIHIMDELRRLTGCAALPDDLSAPGALGTLSALAAGAGVACAPPRTAARLLDKLVGALIEPRCAQPTFLTGHPAALSPLAKGDPARPGLTERFELFVGCRELANAYTELNDPAEQRARFRAQAADAAAGDAEAQAHDEEFVRALEYGLPPTAGWGCGVDRLVMIMAGQASIRDVLLFPTLKTGGLQAGAQAQAVATQAQAGPAGEGAPV